MCYQFIDSASFTWIRSGQSHHLQGIITNSSSFCFVPATHDKHAKAMFRLAYKEKQMKLHYHFPLILLYWDQDQRFDCSIQFSANQNKTTSIQQGFRCQGYRDLVFYEMLLCGITTALCIKESSLHFNRFRDLQDATVPPEGDHP